MKRSAGAEFCVGLALAAALVGLTGCKVGPNYKAPQTAAPANWTSAMSGGLSKAAADTNLLERWWTVFNDPMFSDLVERATSGQPGSPPGRGPRAGGARPAGHGQGGALPHRGSECVGQSDHGQQGTGNGATSDFYAASLDASWELDIFGGKRRSLESATASWQASLESLRDVLVSLLAEVALNYVEVRSYQELLSITESNLTTRTETYDITRWRREAGLTTQLDEDQAKPSLEQVRAQMPTLRTSLEQAKYRLAVLLGQPPGALNELLAEAKPVPVAPAEVAVGVPADLLRRRPDVRSAERNWPRRRPKSAWPRRRSIRAFPCWAASGWSRSNTPTSTPPAPARPKGRQSRVDAL